MPGQASLDRNFQIPSSNNQRSSKRQLFKSQANHRPTFVDRKFQIWSSNNHCLVMSATADSSCGELSEALQRNVSMRPGFQTSLIYFRLQLARINRDPSLGLRMTSVPEYLDVGLSGLKHHASITTGVPSSTISNNSITSALRIRTQPWLAVVPILCSCLVP